MARFWPSRPRSLHADFCTWEHIIMNKKISIIIHPSQATKYQALVLTTHSSCPQMLTWRRKVSITFSHLRKFRHPKIFRKFTNCGRKVPQITETSRVEPTFSEKVQWLLRKFLTFRLLHPRNNITNLDVFVMMLVFYWHTIPIYFVCVLGGTKWRLFKI